MGIIILITIDNETPETALIRILRDKIGADVPITLHGSLKSGSLRIEIERDPLTSEQAQAVETGIKNMLHVRGIDTLVSIE